MLGCDEMLCWFVYELRSVLRLDVDLFCFGLGCLLVMYS